MEEPLPKTCECSAAPRGISTAQNPQGHKGVKMMIYTHHINCATSGVRSPVDEP